MFGFARTLVQHKLLLVALLFAGYFLFAGEKEVPQPSSPWGANAPAQAVSIGPKKATLTEKALRLVNSAAEYAGVADYMPAAVRDQAVGSMNQAETALTNASKLQD